MKATDLSCEGGRGMKNFKDIMELQSKQPIHHLRERSIDDILTSIVAECIEFNEETVDSHKTWISKPYSEKKELEELCDIYLFFAELLNRGFNLPDEYFKAFDEFKECAYTDILQVIKWVACGLPHRGFKELVYLSRHYGYTKEDVLQGCLRKCEKNKSREDWR